MGVRRRIARAGRAPVVTGELRPRGPARPDRARGREGCGARRVVLDSLGGIFAQLDPRTSVTSSSGSPRRCGRWASPRSSPPSAPRTRLDRPLRRRGVRRRQRHRPPQRARGGEAPADRRDPQVPRHRAPEGPVPVHDRPRRGIIVIPLSAIELKQKSSIVRGSRSGNDELDGMCGGGFFRDSVILVSGATGTGKTLAHRIPRRWRRRSGERCLLFAFEESRDQLVPQRHRLGRRLRGDGGRRPARAWSASTPRRCDARGPPASQIKREIEEFRPNRVAVDSLSALERVLDSKSFREFVIGLTSFIKHRRSPGCSPRPRLTDGGHSVTETAHLDHHRFDHPAALRRDLRRDAARARPC